MAKDEKDQPKVEPEEFQRWTAKRRTALMVSIIRGETSAQEAARKHGLTVAEVEEWKEKFLFGAENALRSRPREDEAQQQEQVRRLKQKVADLLEGGETPLLLRPLRFKVGCSSRADFRKCGDPRLSNWRGPRSRAAAADQHEQGACREHAPQSRPTPPGHPGTSLRGHSKPPRASTSSPSSSAAHSPPRPALSAEDLDEQRAQERIKAAVEWISRPSARPA